MSYLRGQVDTSGALYLSWAVLIFFWRIVWKSWALYFGINNYAQPNCSLGDTVKCRIQCCSKSQCILSLSQASSPQMDVSKLSLRKFHLNLNSAEKLFSHMGLVDPFGAFFGSGGKLCRLLVNFQMFGNLLVFGHFCYFFLV